MLNNKLSYLYIRNSLLPRWLESGETNSVEFPHSLNRDQLWRYSNWSAILFLNPLDMDDQQIEMKPQPSRESLKQGNKSTNIQNTTRMSYINPHLIEKYKYNIDYEV